MRFAAPLAFLGLVAFPIVLLTFAWLERRRAQALGEAGDFNLIEALADAGRNAGRTRRAVHAWMLALSTVFAAIALARPQFGLRTEVRKARGMDVVVALDLSQSMLARDVVPSRLERARIELGDLIDQLRGDRVGLVGFTSVALPLSPLTVDHASVKLQLNAAVPGDLPRGGTSVAEAIDASMRMLKTAKKSGAAKAIVIVTDGEDHAGRAEKAAEKAKSTGVEVHVVGVGSRTGEPIPVLSKTGALEGYLKDRAGRTVVSRLNEQMVSQVAAAGGGIAALPNAQGGLRIDGVHNHLSTLKKAELEDRTVRVYEERYQWPLGLALLLLFVATMVRPRRARRIITSMVVALGLCASSGIARASGPFEQVDPDVKRGNQHLRDGNAEEAAKSYAAAEARLGKDGRLLFNQGLAEVKRGELDAAAARFRSAAESAKTPAIRSQAAFALGNTMRALKKYDEAIKAYQQSLFENPKNTGARKNLEIARAQKIIQALQPKDPNQPKEPGDEPPPPSQDAGPQDAGPDGGPPDAGPNEAGSGDSGKNEEPEGQDGGQNGQDGGQPPQGEDGGSGEDGGGSSPPPEAEQPEEDEPSDRSEAEEVLDALEEQEKALKRKRLREKIRGRKVEKNW